MKSYTQICVVCKNEFKTGCPTAKYCNYECRETYYRQQKHDNICKKCGNKWTSNKVESYCSKECSETSNLRICKNCNKEFWTSNRKYCSEECYQEHLVKRGQNKYKKVTKQNYESVVRFRVTEIIKRGIEGRENFKDRISLNYSNSNFTENIKEEVLKRDNYSCQVCGKSTTIECHHIVKRIHGGGDDLDNIIAICRSCHRIIDTFDIERAVRKCTKNAKKYLGIEVEPIISDHKRTLDITIGKLDRLYESLTKLNCDDIDEILIQLDEIIENGNVGY